MELASGSGASIALPCPARTMRGPPAGTVSSSVGPTNAGRRWFSKRQQLGKRQPANDHADGGGEARRSVRRYGVAVVDAADDSASRAAATGRFNLVGTPTRQRPVAPAFVDPAARRAADVIPAVGPAAVVHPTASLSASAAVPSDVARATIVQNPPRRGEVLGKFCVRTLRAPPHCGAGRKCPNKWPSRNFYHFGISGIVSRRCNNKHLDLSAAVSDAAGTSKRPPEQMVMENRHGEPTKRAPRQRLAPKKKRT